MSSGSISCLELIVALFVSLFLEVQQSDRSAIEASPYQRKMALHGRSDESYA